MPRSRTNSRVCAVFGKTYLREVDEEDFCRQLPAVRAAAGDRAVLRAMHVYDENRRVRAEVQALRAGDFARFLALVNASGDSSWEYLQNITPAGAAARQDMALTLALCRRLLAGPEPSASTAAGSRGRRSPSSRRSGFRASRRGWSGRSPPAAAACCGWSDFCKGIGG